MRGNGEKLNVQVQEGTRAASVFGIPLGAKARAGVSNWNDQWGRNQ